MQAHTSHDKAVRLSVTRVYCDKTNESSANIVIPWKIHSSSFLTRRMVGGERPLLPEILDQTDPSRLPRFKNGDFSSIFAHRASALRRSQNVQLHVSRLQAFQWTAYVAPLLRILKREGAHKCKLTIFIFLYKKCTSVEKVCCKVSLCENFQSQSCKAFTGPVSYTHLTLPTKRIV